MSLAWELRAGMIFDFEGRMFRVRAAEHRSGVGERRGARPPDSRGYPTGRVRPGRSGLRRHSPLQTQSACPVPSAQPYPKTASRRSVLARMDAIGVGRYRS